MQGGLQNRKILCRRCESVGSWLRLRRFLAQRQNACLNRPSPLQFSQQICGFLRSLVRKSQLVALRQVPLDVAPPDSPKGWNFLPPPTGTTVWPRPAPHVVRALLDWIESCLKAGDTANYSVPTQCLF